MKKILFMIHDLGQGGAEKVLVNLVNNMDKCKFDITVLALFAGGVNEQFLAPDVHFCTMFSNAFPGNSKIMKLWTPTQLHKLCMKEEYDIEVSYLEGPSARVISGCPSAKTKKIAWIHSTMLSEKDFSGSFRNRREAINCYGKFDKVICVSKGIQEAFSKISGMNEKLSILYNTIESDKIRIQAKDSVNELFDEKVLNLVTVGSLKSVKGYGRLLKIVKRLREEGFDFKLYILGMGPLENSLREYIHTQKLDNVVKLLGYQTNPYKYVAKSDLYICSSYSEGFSTAVVEALVLGVPVCTVEVSGMREILGERNQYGLIVKNNDEDLYQGIKRLLADRTLLNYYKEQAVMRGEFFQKDNTVSAVERMFEEVMNND